MKTTRVIAVAALFFSSALVQATGQEQDNTEHHPASVDSGTQQKQAGPAGAMPMMQMHESMQKMHEQMVEINQTKDPDKRDKLMRAHITDMQNVMQTMMNMMQGMHGEKPMMGSGSMMGQGMGMQAGGNMGGQMNGKSAESKTTMTGEQQTGMMKMMARQQMMEQRMDMMQMMMDQMLQSQAASQETQTIRDRRHDDRATK